MSDQGYLYISDIENYELLSVLSNAHKAEELDPELKKQVGQWIGRLTEGNDEGIDGVALDQKEAVSLIDHLYTVSSEAESELHVNTRAILHRLEDTLREARVPQAKRRISMDGPGR